MDSSPFSSLPRLFFSSALWIALLSSSVSAASPYPLEFETNVSLPGVCGRPLASCRCYQAADPSSLLLSSRPCGLTTVDINVLGAADHQEELTTLVRSLIGSVSERRVIPVAQAPMSCYEHRTTNEVVGSWGGDPVFMIMALVVVEQQREKQLSAAEVTKFVRTYIAKNRAPFIVYHSDTDTHAYIANKLGLDSVDMLTPPPILQDMIFGLFSDPLAHGCEVLRELISEPTKFGVRSQLTIQVITSLLSILWDAQDPLAQRIRYYVYHGSKHTDPFVPASTEPVVRRVTWPNGLNATITSVRPGEGQLCRPNLQFGYSTGFLRHKYSLPTLSQATSNVLQLDLTGTRSSFSPTTRLRALVQVRVSPVCMAKRSSAVPLPPSMEDDVGRTYQIAVLHPQAVEGRLNATAALASSSFGIDAAKTALSASQLAGLWQDLLEGQISIGKPDFPKVDVFFT